VLYNRACCTFPRQILVHFYPLQSIVALKSSGCPADKPFAVVAQGTSNNQQVVLGTISDIAERLKAMPLPSPALLMMGDVIKANGYAEQLAAQTLSSYPTINISQV
jgi:siroheme synthase